MLILSSHLLHSTGNNLRNHRPYDPRVSPHPEGHKTDGLAELMAGAMQPVSLLGVLMCRLLGPLPGSAVSLGTLDEAHVGGRGSTS